MNVLFATQSNSLGLFLPLADILTNGARGKAGFTVADSAHYERFIAQNPQFEDGRYTILKEWEVTAKRRSPPDLSDLAKYERDLKIPGLFGAIVADRRLLLGPDCTYTQDYRRRFSDDELSSILMEAVITVEDLFDEVQPDLVVTFVCVTLLDYLVHFVAKARDIPAFNLRPASLGNQILVADTLRDPAPNLAKTYQRILATGSPRLEDAQSYLHNLRQKVERYEGAVPPSAAPARKVSIRNPLSAPVRFLKSWLVYRSSEAKSDNHVPGLVRPALFKALISPRRARQTNRFLEKYYLNPLELENIKYAFYPMHTEPEVSLMVYCRPILNQIEVIRWLALSLPADMVLLIKEHPWMIGKRSINSYRKILDIPRVRIAPPQMEARTLIEQSKLVAVLQSSVGQEAAFCGKPVLTLGPCAINILPDDMVRHAGRLYELDATIRSILKDHKNDERALLAYIAALLETSVAIDLYGGLLQRGGLPSSSDKKRDEDLARLAEFLIKKVQNAEKKDSHSVNSAFAGIW